MNPTRRINEIKICPICKFANKLDATICRRCQAALVPLLPARITVPVPLKALRPSSLEHARYLTDIQNDDLVLIVVGGTTPIRIKKREKIILGRESSDADKPSVDLNPYEAYLYGVSRRHALLTTIKGICSVVDLESSNGTWLNEQKLVPNRSYRLQSGDILRLGQLGIYVYFYSEATARKKYVLTDLTKPHIQLTPGYLLDTVSPYLKALATIQEITCFALERPHTNFLIKSMAMDAEAGTLGLMLEADEDILRFVEVAVGSWRQKYAHEIRRLWALDLLMLQPDPRQREECQQEDAELLRVLQKALVQTVIIFIMQFIPNLTEGARLTYVRRLLPSFLTIARGYLSLTTELVAETNASS